MRVGVVKTSEEREVLRAGPGQKTQEVVAELEVPTAQARCDGAGRHLLRAAREQRLIQGCGIANEKERQLGARGEATNPSPRIPFDKADRHVAHRGT